MRVRERWRRFDIGASFDVSSFMSPARMARALNALDGFDIETPSWGYADTGTRFGKFYQPAAALTLADKLADAAHVNSLTGCCPTLALHVEWDVPLGTDLAAIAQASRRLGIRIGSINPNLFQDQRFKWGSFANASADVRNDALRQCVWAIDIAKTLRSPVVSIWLADGLSYPGQECIRQRKRRVSDCLRALHKRLGAGQQILIEYKPFEPAFYATDIADWGMAAGFAKRAGSKAKVLVDTGHHYASQNVEQIVAWLLDEDILGGFHFNDRRYADDDLTLGSIDPYQIFRIFHEVHSFARDRGGRYPRIAYMIDQSHNEKPKVEAMLQTVMMAQELYAKAALVDHPRLRKAQARHDVVTAELLLKDAFFSDVTPALQSWRRARGLPMNPLREHRRMGYEQRAARDREARRAEMKTERASAYA